MNAAQCIVVGLLRLYQWILSPLLAALCPGAGCRFTPTCSEFAVQAVQSGGVLRGTGQALRRLMRCHPWGGCGCDPVLPPPSGHSAAAH